MFGLGIFLFVTFLMLFLGSVVLVHDPRNQVNRLFFTWVLFAVFWMIANYLENVSFFTPDARAALLRTDFASAMLAAGFISLFIASFINRKIKSQALSKYLLPAIVLAILSYTPWVLAQVFISSADEVRFVPGLGFYFYVLVIIAYFAIPGVMLLRARHLTPPSQRAQITSVTVGMGLSAVIMLTVNLFLQNYISAAWFRLGIYSAVFFVIGVSWAIIRHEFLRVRFVVVELLLLGILATLLAKVIISSSLRDLVLNLVVFLVMLVLGFAMVRSFLNEERQREEIQKSRDDLERKNEDLQKLDKLKNTMLSVAAHQLRGPLGGIRGYLTMMRDGDLGPVNEKQHEALAMNLNVLSRLMNAVETFLDLGMLEAGKISFQTETVALDEIVAGIVEEFGAPMKRKGLVLGFNCPARRPVLVHVDPNKVKHIIFNVIDNAMKYTEIGSIKVTVEATESEAIVKVADTGVGLSAADLAHLFRKFERGHFISDQGGSGLGLYVVKTLTEMQHGHVRAESAGVGQGTIFSVTFPLAKKP